MLCFLDTDILIYFHKAHSSKTAPSKFEKVRAFIEQEKNNKKIFAISQLTLTEFLQGLPVRIRLDSLDWLRKEFIIQPYDDLVSLRAAEIRFDQAPKIEGKYTEKHTKRAGRAVMFNDIQNIAATWLRNI